MWPLSALANYAGTTEEIAHGILLQLQLTGVADVEFFDDGITNGITNDNKGDNKTLTKSNKGITKLSNRRLVRETENKERVRRVRSEAGKKGMERRWQNDNKNNILPSPSPSHKNHKNDSYKRLTPPGWLPEQAWKQFKEHRQRLRKPLTARGEELAIKTLDKLRAEGHDPAEVIDNSILNGWQGLFPPREAKHGRAAEPKGFQAIRDIQAEIDDSAVCADMGKTLRRIP